MKTSGVVELLFGSPGRVKLLRRLAEAPQPLSGRQAAELAGLTHRGAIQALSVLVDLGVVTQRQAGRAYQYALAESNILVQEIVLPAFAAEKRLRRILEEDIVDQFAGLALSLVLFGSVARGEQTPQSDVDLLAVVANEKDRETMEEIASSRAPAFQSRFGAPLAVHVLTVGQLREKRRSPFLVEAARDGVVLHGKPLKELSRSRG